MSAFSSLDQYLALETGLLKNLQHKWCLKRVKNVIQQQTSRKRNIGNVYEIYGNKDPTSQSAYLCYRLHHWNKNSYIYIFHHESPFQYNHNCFILPS